MKLSEARSLLPQIAQHPRCVNVAIQSDGAEYAVFFGITMPAPPPTTLFPVPQPWVETHAIQDAQEWPKWEQWIAQR